jgi:aldehyde:ferredoxin oxidoreductase
MRIVPNGAAGDPQTVFYRRCTIDLAREAVDIGDVECRNLEEVLGGFGRSFQYLATRDVTDAFAIENPMVVNTGLLTGSNVMTGLRTYFSSYSPLKVSNTGLPAAMWSAGSGKFGSKLKWAGLDELILENKAERPVIIVIRESDDGPQVSLRSADHLLGKYCHHKILTLYEEYPNAHFAAIGPAGEHHDACYYAAIALSTENLLKSGDDKCRWAGRGGMGAVLGSKNVIGIVAEAQDRTAPLSVETRALNKEIATGPGSRKFREKKKGGLGGTWANYEPLEQFHMVPQNNFRPNGDGKPELMFRDALEEAFVIKAESCYRCGINCHKNIYERKADGSKGEFRAKFDYEPLNLLSTNAGVDDPHEVWPLVALVDHLGMDTISCATTIDYVLDYNARHPDAPVFNGATFGDAGKIRELIEQVGTGQLPELGHGVKRLSEQLGEPGYAMQCKGLELPAYVPDTNPGYPWAIAGGHMSMATYMLVAIEGDTSLDYWVKAITERGLLMVRDDLLGVCKFSGLSAEAAAGSLKQEVGLEVTRDELLGAVRRAFIRGLWLERKQGYARDDYTMPAQVFDSPNPAIKAEPFVTRDFFTALSDRVWEVFDREIDSLPPLAAP